MGIIATPRRELLVDDHRHGSAAEQVWVRIIVTPRRGQGVPSTWGAAPTGETETARPGNAWRNRSRLIRLPHRAAPPIAAFRDKRRSPLAGARLAGHNRGAQWLAGTTPRFAMRTHALIVMTASLLLAADTPSDDLKKLQGTWKIAALIFDGRPVEDAEIQGGTLHGRG